MKVNAIVYGRGEAKYVYGKKPDIFEACFGIDNEQIEIARFDTEEEAKKALNNYKAPTAWVTRTMYGKVWMCEAYAVEFYEENENGEFINGSDYDYLEPVFEEI